MSKDKVIELKPEQKVAEVGADKINARLIELQQALAQSEEALVTLQQQMDFHSKRKLMAQGALFELRELLRAEKPEAPPQG